MLDRKLHALATACLAPGTLAQDEQVAHEPADRRVRLTRHGGADEVVLGTTEERDHRAGLLDEGVRVLVEPVLVDQVAVTEVLDPGATRLQRPGDAARPR